MKIVYLLAEWLDPATGPARKIEGQVRAWRQAGHEVEVLAFDRPVRGARILREAGSLAEAAMGLGPDVVYIRHHTFVPAARRLLRHSPGVLEINSDDIAELRTRRLPYRLYHRATRGLTFRSAVGVIAPTYELAARPSIAMFGRPVAVIANGIDLDASPLLPVPSNDRPRLLFTYSSTGPWPGVDLLLRAADRLREFDFDVVGPVPRGPASPNVRLHGILTGDSYEAVLNRADIGVGSLGMHRIGLTEGSTLKVRGYLAAGLPTILAYKDTDFIGGAPFLLELPAREDAVETSLSLVRAFVQAQVGTRVPRASVAHLDSKHKELVRLQLLSAAATGDPW